jgi:hypothetical protein
MYAISKMIDDKLGRVAPPMVVEQKKPDIDLSIVSKMIDDKIDKGSPSSGYMDIISKRFEEMTKTPENSTRVIDTFQIDEDLKDLKENLGNDWPPKLSLTKWVQHIDINSGNLQKRVEELEKRMNPTDKDVKKEIEDIKKIIGPGIGGANFTDIVGPGVKGITLSDIIGPGVKGIDLSEIIGPGLKTPENKNLPLTDAYNQLKKDFDELKAKVAAIEARPIPKIEIPKAFQEHIDNEKIHVTEADKVSLPAIKIMRKSLYGEKEMVKSLVDPPPTDGGLFDTTKEIIKRVQALEKTVIPPPTTTENEAVPTVTPVIPIYLRIKALEEVKPVAPTTGMQLVATTEPSAITKIESRVKALEDVRSVEKTEPRDANALALLDKVSDRIRRVENAVTGIKVKIVDEDDPNFMFSDKTSEAYPSKVSDSPMNKFIMKLQEYMLKLPANEKDRNFFQDAQYDLYFALATIATFDMIKESEAYNEVLKRFSKEIVYKYYYGDNGNGVLHEILSRENVMSNNGLSRLLGKTPKFAELDEDRRLFASKIISLIVAIAKEAEGEIFFVEESQPNIKDRLAMWNNLGKLYIVPKSKGTPPSWVQEKHRVKNIDTTAMILVPQPTTQAQSTALISPQAPSTALVTQDIQQLVTTKVAEGLTLDLVMRALTNTNLPGSIASALTDATTTINTKAVAIRTGMDNLYNSYINDTMPANKALITNAISTAVTNGIPTVIDGQGVVASIQNSIQAKVTDLIGQASVGGPLKMSMEGSVLAAVKEKVPLAIQFYDEEISKAVGDAITTSIDAKKEEEIKTKVSGAVSNSIQALQKITDLNDIKKLNEVVRASVADVASTVARDSEAIRKAVNDGAKLYVEDKLFKKKVAAQLEEDTKALFGSPEGISTIKAGINTILASKDVLNHTTTIAKGLVDTALRDAQPTIDTITKRAEDAARAAALSAANAAKSHETVKRIVEDYEHDMNTISPEPIGPAEQTLGPEPILSDVGVLPNPDTPQYSTPGESAVYQHIEEKPSEFYNQEAEVPQQQPPMTKAEEQMFLDVGADQSPFETIPPPVETFTPSEQTPIAPTPQQFTPSEQTPIAPTPQQFTPSEQTPIAPTPQQFTPSEQTPIAPTPQQFTPSEQTPIAPTPQQFTPSEQTLSDVQIPYNPVEFEAEPMVTDTKKIKKVVASGWEDRQQHLRTVPIQSKKDPPRSGMGSAQERLRLWKKENPSATDEEINKMQSVLLARYKGAADTPEDIDDRIECIDYENSPFKCMVRGFLELDSECKDFDISLDKFIAALPHVGKCRENPTSSNIRAFVNAITDTCDTLISWKDLSPLQKQYATRLVLIIKYMAKAKRSKIIGAGRDFTNIFEGAVTDFSDAWNVIDQIEVVK